MIFLLEGDTEARKGILSRLFSRSMNIKCISEYGAELCIVSVKNKRCIDWLRIQSMLGEGDCIIAQKDIEVPYEIHLPQPDGAMALQQLIFSAARQVVKAAHYGGARLTVLLTDRAASFIESMPALSALCAQLYVLTDENEAYCAQAEKALTEYGSAPMILDDTFSLQHCDIIIAPCGISGCGALPLPKMIFAPNGSDCISVCEQCICLPPIFDEINTDKYNKFALAEAIFCCKSYNGATPYAEDIKWRDKISHYNELASIFYT